MGYGAEDAIRIARKKGIPVKRITPFDAVKTIYAIVWGFVPLNEVIMSHMEQFVELTDNIHEDSKKLLDRQNEFKIFLWKMKKNNYINSNK